MSPETTGSFLLSATRGQTGVGPISAREVPEKHGVVAEGVGFELWLRFCTPNTPVKFFCCYPNATPARKIW